MGLTLKQDNIKLHRRVYSQPVQGAKAELVVKGTGGVNGVAFHAFVGQRCGQYPGLAIGCDGGQVRNLAQ